MVSAEARPGARLMLIGQAPSAAALQASRPFAGPGGRRLDEWFGWAGLDHVAWRREVYITAMTRCFPGPHPRGKGDRKPSRAEMARCRPWLDRQLTLLDPVLVILVGGLAITSFLGPLTLDAAVGGLIARGHPARLYLPWPHPSGVSTWLNDPARVERVRRSAAVLRQWLTENLPDLPLLPAAPADDRLAGEEDA